jgi:integrase
MSGRIRFDRWATGFFTEESRYVKLRRAHGHSLSKKHVYTQQGICDRDLIPRFGRYHLDEITAEMVENYLLGLYDGTGDRKLQPRTVNGIRSVLKTLFNEAVRLGHLRHNPVAATHKFKETPKQRGILSRRELWELLFKPGANASVWHGNERDHLFCLTAAVTAMRKGEVMALMPANVHDTWIDVRHGWDQVEGLTPAPKWGHRRVATIPPALSEALRDWIAQERIPFDSWVFPASRRDGTGKKIPVSPYHIKHSLDDALARIGIDDTTRRQRNIVFHSMRHSVVTHMRAAAVDSWQAKQVTGHRTDSVFEHYGDHATPDMLGDVARFQTALMAPPEEAAQ